MVREARRLHFELVDLVRHEDMVRGALVRELGRVAGAAAVLVRHDPLVLAGAGEPRKDHGAAEGSADHQGGLHVAQLQFEQCKVVLW